ncbi:MAG: hypothetical protein ACK5NT_13750 [Pyrinomonadaceae bacterium]
MSKIETERVIEIKRDKGEEGAAIVIVLMVSLLLLVASAGLILEVSKNSANITDATAEQQAYNAAESGIQSALNVLRGNSAPSPLIDSSKSSDAPENRIDFRKAVNSATSNFAADIASPPRLSRWIQYNYTPSGSATPTRVSIGSEAYNPATGVAYSLEIEDPDHTGMVLSYNTSASIDGTATSKTFGSGENTVTLTYNLTTKSDLNVSSGSANTDFGSLKVKVEGSGAAIPSEGVRFELAVNLTEPYKATKIMRGTILGGAITNLSTGTVKIDWDSQEFMVMGSKMMLALKSLTLNPPVTNSGVTSINGTMTPVEPIRLLVRSTGYGPRGSVKILEAMVRKNFFDGMTAPATLTLVGPPTGFAFASGRSQNVTYSGNDVVTGAQIPSIGVSNNTNLQAVDNDLATTGRKTDVYGAPANVSTELPKWLQSAENLDDLLQALKSVAVSSGTYYPSGSSVPSVGNNANATGLTYVDGNLNLSGSGGGILVVRGNLILKGGFDFNGLIIVTGSNGLARSGGGNGTLQGNIVIASYDPNNLQAGFTGARYDISGGGTSEVVYNSSSLANGLTAVSNFVLGVADK